MAYMPMIVVLLLTGSGLWLAGSLLLRIASYRPENGPSDLSDYTIAEYDCDRYEPMAHLLDPSELEFLANQQGLSPKMVANFRRERRQIFRMYLHDLAGDFSRLHRQARELVATGSIEHSELVGMLMRQQVSFWKTLVSIEIQLGLDSVGVGNINSQKLVDLVTDLSAAIARATAVPGPVLA